MNSHTTNAGADSCGQAPFVEINIPPGLVMKIDTEDTHLLGKHHVRGHRSRDYFYARVKIHGKWHRVHRLVIAAKEGEIVDHINRDTMDNRRSNLRIATHQQSAWNSNPIKKSRTGVKGVHIERNGRILVTFKHDGKIFRKFGFKSVREAALFYNEKITALRGEFAVINTIPG